ncbi:pyruvate dehydrogenase (lipoamide) kinase, putative [Trypanosoma equiperdum]|uniref:Protein-serine/threonine kinase n=2 Tax=Trypanozoon TaxID=39700 RepID=Q385U0_TRYB2|nr:pyruvate dehydrogenase (lipoamide) kinase, putative [Trypanosoma brucei brucei TREU927]EAN79441.1 pyruvate dehydrogenase (lipoamide) kinase, putative [Trypanosoma brucei brucei TREU927]SCU66433.1 pyruvate dehydrogenase (lipoamide) kinase, putative [Trypanosoma equiperdum]
MFRCYGRKLSPQLRDIIHRLDFIEKQIIDLKAFRDAVQATLPSVATAADALARKRQETANQINVVAKDPLTSEEFVELNQYYAVQMVQTLALRNMVHIRTHEDLYSHARLIHREYLVRVAQRARALSHACVGLSQMPSIQELRRWYEWSFHDVRSTKAPVDAEGALKFDTLVRRLFLRHYNVSALLSEGMHELGERQRWDEHSHSDDLLTETFDELQRFFDEFCMGRVRLRFLVGNYVQLSTQILRVEPRYSEKLTAPMYFDHDPESFVGQICQRCSLIKLVECAIRSARASYSELGIELRVAVDPDATLSGIPYITYDILSALIDDAIQANVLRQEKYGIPFTPVVITIAQRNANEQFSVRVSDTAGGMPLHLARHVLKYWFAYKCTDDMLKLAKTWTHSPIRLPYAYCAAKVLGGDISVVSIDGYGTDRFLHLPSDGIERVRF